MAIQNNYRTWAFKADEDLNNATAGTGHIYKAVAQGTGKLANDGKTATGILQYLSESGEHVTQGWDGVMKFTAGAAISAADTALTVTTSGYFLTADDGDYIVGRSLASVTSGSVGYGVFNFSVPNRYDLNADTVDISAKTDLSASEGLAVDFSTGEVADTTDVAGGILVKGVTSGGTGKVRSIGVVSAKAGDDVTADASLQVTTGGYLIDGASGDILCGRATAAANSGATFTALVNFATPHYATTSNDVAI
jgi:hypothetical protein